MIHERRREAVADALAGVVGSVVSLWAFWPLDVWKINIQASHRGSRNTKDMDLLRGLPVKTLHTISSSFCYFYLYSWLSAWWAQRKKRRGEGISTSTHLLLSAVAAMLNTCMTLPLDVIATQHQTKKGNKTEQLTSSETMQKVWDQLDEETFHDATEEEEDHSEIVEEKKDDHCEAIELPSSKEKPYVPEITSLWKGLWPSLMLCSNPSINFTVFDLIKARRLRSRHGEKLSMGEAFVMGLVAKFVATMATYPLIRAKVMLMVTSQSSMFDCLKEQYNNHGGIRACYKGLDLQLFHTLLKSALLMMIRERITGATRRLLLPSTRKTNNPF